ncbi:MAG: helix-turn-helix domain-containing protein [Treponema sp.]|jgi:AraC family transcriptional regulator|nr:helix-turn-helix domain-containing protein [Treponema sp.]
MLKPYELFENILLDIESGIKNNINTSILSKKYNFSEGHFRRLFSFAFKQSIAAYIRSRTLAASLNDILKTDTNILEIAAEYGFEYEQSYIRAFKREYGITPGDLRKTGQIIKITPILHLSDENKLGESVIFGPDIVMVPRFHIIGKSYQIPFENSMEKALQLAKQFWEIERRQIEGTVNQYVYFGLIRNMNQKKKPAEYIPSVQAENIKNIPQGFSGITLETSMYARFRYIGQHHYYDIDKNISSMMDNAVINFAQNENSKYKLSDDKTYFEMLDTRLYDGTYCQIEFYVPVSEKQ